MINLEKLYDFEHKLNEIELECKLAEDTKKEINNTIAQQKKIDGQNKKYADEYMFYGAICVPMIFDMVKEAKINGTKFTDKDIKTRFYDELKDDNDQKYRKEIEFRLKQLTKRQKANKLPDIVPLRVPVLDFIKRELDSSGVKQGSGRPIEDKNNENPI